MTPEEAARSFNEAEAELRQVVESSKRLGSAQESLEAAREALARASEEQAAQHAGAVQELGSASNALLDAAAEVEHASHSLQETAAALTQLTGKLTALDPAQIQGELTRLNAQAQRNGKLLLAGTTGIVLVLVLVLLGLTT